MCDKCEFKMPFGKFEGEELGVLRLAEKDYLEWIHDNFKDGPVKDAVETVLTEHQ